ncbi:MAG: Co2+/Mg2+ efflux protein ApaG [Bacteroidia bacterium]
MGTQATIVTHGIKISVETKFQNEHSDSEHRHFLFSYKITIENTSEFTVKLIDRHWDIFDSGAEHIEVDGKGVVGEQPILAQGDFFQYESACSITSDVGKMSGFYLMERTLDKLRFKTAIPEFELVTPARLN